MARKNVTICDQCKVEIPSGKGALLRLTYTDARRGAKQADLCDGCADETVGEPTKRRGRPLSVAA